MNTSANIINHIGLLLDASTSMARHAQNLIKVADSQIEHLARRSKELDQETRISVWIFADPRRFQCVVWDKDVLRLPSIAPYYSTNGNTALIDATLQAVSDLAETPERYGDHSFLLYAMTDGEENASSARPHALSARLSGLPGNWTLAALVPNANGVHEAKRFGFPAGNIEVWDTTSTLGAEEAGGHIRRATDAYMQARASGIRSTTTLFKTDASTVNALTIQQAGLKALTHNAYVLIPVPREVDIRGFTEECGLGYVVGRGFYELNKTETIQPQKEIAVVERAGRSNVYVGRDARQLIGLPDMAVRVKPDYNREYAIFVQSTSVNRKLLPGTRYLYLK